MGKKKFEELVKKVFKEDKELLKRRLMRVESMLAEEQITPEDWKEVRKSREEIRKGKYVTLEQLKKESNKIK